VSTPFRTNPPSVWRVGAIRNVHAQPLFQTLLSSPDTSGELLFDTAASHIERLMSKEMDAAFISPMDYAVNSSDLIILPGIGVTSSGFSSLARLYFKGEMLSIETMAIGIVSTLDVVLARLVLGEKYDAAPAIVPHPGVIDDMLRKADSALVTGEDLLTVASDKPFIDLVDEWSDMTELPFVHTICVMRNESYDKALHDHLLDAQQRGRLLLEQIAGDLSVQRKLPNEKIYTLLSSLSYGLDDESSQSLGEFYRMAFYFGMLGDVPELNFAQ
jgi:predicted solute-binding protein